MSCRDLTTRQDIRRVAPAMAAWHAPFYSIHRIQSTFHFQQVIKKFYNFPAYITSSQITPHLWHKLEICEHSELVEVTQSLAEVPPDDERQQINEKHSRHGVQDCLSLPQEWKGWKEKHLNRIRIHGTSNNIPSNLWHNVHHIPKLKCFSSHLVVVFAQSTEAGC